jgi:type I restriction enzyme M protein
LLFYATQPNTEAKIPMRNEDLQDFITGYHPENRHQRNETCSVETPEGRRRKFTCNEIAARDKISLESFRRIVEGLNNKIEF